MHITFTLETAVIRRQFFSSLIQSSAAIYVKLFNAQSAIKWITDCITESISCHTYTKVNDYVVCGVLAEQTVY